MAALVLGCGDQPETTPSPSSAEQAASVSGCPVGETMEGVVAEAFDVSRYTYLRLETSSGSRWAAVLKSDVGAGETVRLVHPFPVKGFRSPKTGMSFDTLYMGFLVREADSARITPGSATGVRGACTAI
jgi:hypothetical protein